ncbi:solute carrier family 22 member 14 isoform X1 [Sarcophilus harrisii]|uniref:Major facilitator superfamily (MFS) profile domain-containing protein n=1 Tax=Sarcophilus harrisii TaxID=9305 RepID=G3WBK9_SARHA|nr:solute carrier family 22 member 14 isoform X1 [Sarcophilus harrisii]
MQNDLEDGSRKKVQQFSRRVFGRRLFKSEKFSNLDAYLEILQAAGEFGTFQRRLVALTFIPSLLTAFFVLDGGLLQKTQSHHCYSDWLLTIQPNLTMEEVYNLSLPKKDDGSFEECRMYSPVQRDFDSIVKYGLNDTEECQNGWIYVQSEYWTMAREFNLVCDKNSELLEVRAIFVIGILCGSLIVGTLCDRLGCHRTILTMMLCYAIFGFGLAFVPSFSVYKAFQFGVGVTVMGYQISSIILVSEWLVVSRRAQAIALEHCFYVLGLIIFSVLTSKIPHWRLLRLAGGSPVFLLISYIWILPESPMWLLTKGKMEKAKGILCRAADVNKKVIPPELFQQLIKEKIHYGTILNILQRRPLRRILIILFYLWFSMALSYFGLTSKGHKHMKEYGGYLTLGLMQVPVHLFCIILTEKLGRKNSQILTLFLGGFSGLSTVFLSNETNSLDLILILLNQIGLTAAITISFIYTVELFPIFLRQVALGFLSMTYSFSAIVITLIETVQQDQPEFIMMICGSMTISGGFLAFLLPKKWEPNSPEEKSESPKEKVRTVRVLKTPTINHPKEESLTDHDNTFNLEGRPKGLDQNSKPSTSAFQSLNETSSELKDR